MVRKLQTNGASEGQNIVLTYDEYVARICGGREGETGTAMREWKGEGMTKRGRRRGS